MTETNLCAARGDKPQIEEGLELALKFDADGLIPAVAVDYQTGDVLMVAYMNAESLALTLEIGEAVYFSRSRKKLWHKGETSGNTQKVHEIRTDCDQDTLVLKVEQIGGACCHNGYRTCFYRRIDNQAARPVTLVNTEPGRVFDPKSVYGG